MRPDGDPKTVSLHTEFLAAVQDAETYEAAVACAKGQGWPAQTVVNAPISVVIQSIARGSRPPAIVMVDVDGAEDVGAMVGQLVKACAGRSHVLIIGSANDVAFYRSIVQAGASDYLLKPVSGMALRDAVVPLLAVGAGTAEKNEKKKSGALHVIIGVRGGVGATTLAVNAAWVLAHEAGLKTALLDLDLQFGNCDLALDLEPGRGLREVLMNPDRMDSLLINSAAARESDQLSVFCGEESLEEIVEFDTSGPLALIRDLRTEYEHVILDIPRFLVPRQRRLIVSAERIFLVADMTLGGIRDTQRVLSSIANLGTAAEVCVVASRLGDGESQISPSQFERSTKTKIGINVPHDTKTIKLSANRGKSIFAVGAGNTALARSIRQVVALMAPGKLGDAVGDSGFLGRLLGGFSGRKG